MKTWIEPQPVSIPNDLKNWTGGYPLVAELLVKRGIHTVDQALAFMDPGKYAPAPPEQLPGLVDVAARVIRAVEGEEMICVWGDFDVDGQTATALLVEALRELGAAVFHHIPVRKTESHGMNVEKVGEVIDRGARLILTCDTGSGEHASIEFARSRGVDVAVTDHHKLSATLPPAAAFTNPQLLPEDHPLKTLPGVGVAWKLAEYLGAYFGKPDLADRGLDLAALGIVADVAELAGDTRWLLQRGIAALRDDRRTGLRELYELAGVEPALIDAETIGFAIAPRLNAIGRLGDANPVVEFLTTAEVTRARVLANLLEGFNGERKLITDQIHASALAMIDADPSFRSEPVLVLARQGWEPGVIGIVAARLAEQFLVPVILISVDPGGAGRGSARSVAGIDITAAIASAADLLEGYGGHTMAGGLALGTDRIGEFRRRVAAAVKSQAPEGLAPDRIEIDGYLALPEIGIDLLEALDRLAPFGPGNRRPLLATRDLEVRTSSGIGRTGGHRRVVVADRDEAVQEVVWWNAGDADLPAGRFDLAYTLGLNLYKGERRVQAVWRAAREIEPGPEDERRPGAGGIQVIDLRRAEDPAGELERLRARGGLIVWGKDGEAQVEPHGGDGDRSILAIWTIPSSPEELQGLVNKFGPREVALFGNPPPIGDVNEFLRRLTGLLRHAVRAYSGQIAIGRLIEAAQQPRAVVEAGLAWLSARGHFDCDLSGDLVEIKAGSGQVSSMLEESGERLKRAFEEAQAFRRYYLKAAPESLIAGSKEG